MYLFLCIFALKVHMHQHVNVVKLCFAQEACETISQTLLVVLLLLQDPKKMIY